VFCAKVLERPELAADPRFSDNTARREHRLELTELIEDYFADMTSIAVVKKLDAAGIANGRLNEPGDVWEHVQFAERDRWRDIVTPAGPVRALLPPFTFTDIEAVMGDVPTLGQHTDAVLHELGFAPARIRALHAAGAV
jgi:crotonobetainyl-CoA:carnitine CoA-transferase CaiB-like acyl-CoA transferase